MNEDLITIDELHLLMDDIEAIAEGTAPEAVYMALDSANISVVNSNEVAELLVSSYGAGVDKGIVKGVIATAIGIYVGHSVIKWLRK